MNFPSTFIDQLQNKVYLVASPQRIISLVPSQTELLFDLGLEQNIVGITKFCIHPAGKVKGKTIIGGTKNFYFDIIDSLQPDLIIGNKEENYPEGIWQLQSKYPVWMSDISDLDQALEMIRQIGQLTETATLANQMALSIKESFGTLKPSLNIPTAYFIWRKPFMCAGSDTFINQMLQLCGFQNVFRASARYPEIKEEQLQQAQPKLILLSSEPYPFREKHLQELQQLCPAALVKLVDGELFSWYGSRLMYSVAYFKQLIEEVSRELRELETAF